MTLQVLADAGEVGLQAVHADVLVVTVTQDVVKVKVQDVGVEAADLQVVLEEGQRSEVRRTNTNRSGLFFVLLQVVKTLLFDIIWEHFNILKI